MNELALFAGAGGGLLASRLLGWRTVCAVEIDPYCRDRIFGRQRDECLPNFPIWDDVCTFDGHPWRGHIDVISGGFPCQDVSAAGPGRGITGARSGLVFEMLRIVEEVRPAFVFAENSPQLRTKGLATIVERLIRMGYVGRVGVLGAGDIGANHERKRMWIVAVAEGIRRRQRGARGLASGTPGQPQRPLQVANVTDSSGEQMGPGGQPWGRFGVGSFGDNATDSDRLWGLQSQRGLPELGQWFGNHAKVYVDNNTAKLTDWWDVPRFAGVDDGVANRMDRIRATGNGQVPGVAALAWSLLTSDL